MPFYDYWENTEMMTSLFSSATGMAAQQKNIATVANNLANVNTVGFKKDRNSFQDLLYSQERAAGGASSSTTQVPGGIHVGHGVKLASTEKIFTQGNIKNTGNDLDISIDGDGFFQVLRPNGTISYTRNGSWRRDSTGRVVTPDGYPLEPEIIIPSGATKVMINESGTVQVLMGGQSAAQPTKIGNIQLARFINPGGLTPIGKNLFTATGASGNAETADPGQTGMGLLSQGYLELSNVNLVDEMVNMITTQRAYEVNSKSIQTSDNMLQTAVNIIR
ncbi:MAG: flagellar basal-body rod protein FlgG [bacterium]